MSETKKELRWFSIMDYEKEARYLSKNAEAFLNDKRDERAGIISRLS